MTATALMLVFVAAVAHAGWNAFAKGGRDPLVFLWLAVGVASVVLAPAAVWSIARHGFDTSSAPYLVATSSLHALYFYSLGRAYQAGDLSRVYPIARGLSVALVAVASFGVLGDAPSVVGVAAIGVVVAGVLVVGLRAGGGRGGVAWALVTGCIIATYSLVDDRGVDRLDPVAYVVFMSAGACALLAPVMWSRRRLVAAEWRTGWRVIMVSAVLTLSGYALVLYAMRLSAAAYVVATREVSIVLSVAIGWVFLGERQALTRFAGAALIVAGVLGLAFA